MTSSKKCFSNCEKLRAIDDSKAIAPIKVLRKIPLFASNAAQFIGLYFIKPIEADTLQGCVR